MSSRMIQIAEPTVGELELDALRDPIESGWLTQGAKVAEFERIFAERHQTAHALATTSCTTALQLALAILGVGPGDEVIVPAFTWVATAAVVVHCGAVPVFVDVDEATYNLRIDQVADALTDKTRAVIPVHLFGLCAEMDELRAAVPESVRLVEDAACAVGAMHGETPAGALGDLAAFSFHPRKIITTGEGGMLTTSDPAYAERGQMLRNHGATISEEVRHAGPQPYLLPDFDEAGFNFRMTDLQGAIGVAQMSRLDGLLADRRARAAWYTEQLAAFDWIVPPVQPPGFTHSWQAYVARIAPGARVDRNGVMSGLHEAGVSTRPGTHAVTDLGSFRGRYTEPSGGCVTASALESSTIALPLHGRMSDDDYDYVVEQLEVAAR